MTQRYILGFDEVGRGSLAGPVTVGLSAVPTKYPLYTKSHGGDFEPSDQALELARDSKNLTPAKRKQVCELASKLRIPSAVFSASNELIDEFGISPCLKHLLLLGINHFDNLFISEIYVDGRVYLPTEINDRLLQSLIKENDILDETIKFPGRDISIVNEDKADDKYLSIAIASNIAKVYRDTYMDSLSTLYPVYNWDTNKGYATKKHREAIALEPNNPVLRKTFIKNIVSQ